MQLDPDYLRREKLCSAVVHQLMKIAGMNAYSTELQASIARVE
jgi:hypothetical protein